MAPGVPEMDGTEPGRSIGGIRWAGSGTAWPCCAGLPGLERAERGEAALGRSRGEKAPPIVCIRTRQANEVDVRTFPFITRERVRDFCGAVSQAEAGWAMRAGADSGAGSAPHGSGAGCVASGCVTRILPKPQHPSR